MRALFYSGISTVTFHLWSPTLCFFYISGYKYKNVPNNLPAPLVCVTIFHQLYNNDKMGLMFFFCFVFLVFFGLSSHTLCFCCMISGVKQIIISLFVVDLLQQHQRPFFLLLLFYSPPHASLGLLLVLTIFTFIIL